MLHALRCLAATCTLALCLCTSALADDRSPGRILGAGFTPGPGAVITKPAASGAACVSTDGDANCSCKGDCYAGESTCGCRADSLKSREKLSLGEPRASRFGKLAGWMNEPVPGGRCESRDGASRCECSGGELCLSADKGCKCGSKASLKALGKR